MRNSIKRLLSLALVIVMVLSCVPTMAFAADEAPVAVNTATGSQYDNLTDALFDAAEGQTVRLEQDVTDSMTAVFDGVTLDLNGYALTTKYMSCYGDLIDSSADNSGLLSVDESRFMLREQNRQLTVKTTEGYRFVEIKGFNTAMVNPTKYAFQPLFEADALELLAQGNAVTGVSIRVHVSWTQAQGARTQDFTFHDSHLIGYAESYKAETGKFGKMFALTLNGAEDFEGLTFAAQVVSDTGVYFAPTASQGGNTEGGNQGGSSEGSGDAATDEEGKLTGDLTLESAHGTALVPAGTKLADGVSKLTLSTTPLDQAGDLEAAGDQQLNSLDVHIEGIAADNDVPVIVTIKDLAPEFLNQGNIELYHVENGETVAMTRVYSLEEVDEHNEYYYDILTGTVTMALASFSPVASLYSVTNYWMGNVEESFSGGSGTEDDPYIIANADQLAYMNYLVSNEIDAFDTACYKLISDIDFGGGDHYAANYNENTGEGQKILWYPIGYWKKGDGANAAGETEWYDYGNAFQGVFDGAGHTVSGIYQRTWDLDGNYDHGYYDAAMGLFGYVYNGTVKNLTVKDFFSEGEFTPTGCVTAYASNSTFENIALVNCHPQVYNTGNGGIVGIGGLSSNTEEDQLIFRNITIDNSNTISALWGSWDVACGGLIGMFRGPGHVYMTNCHVAAQIDVYNDVCGNYQYYWYRYSGMLIGTNQNMITDNAGYTVPETSKYHAEDCTVHFGDWNNYYYCELVANSLASYTHDHQFSRLTEIASFSEIWNGTEWLKTGNFLLIEGENKTCYHIVKKDGVLTRHKHEDSGIEQVNGEAVLKENNQIIYLPFNQLFTGYGWGVKHIPIYDDESANVFPGVTILGREVADSVDKFEPVNEIISVHNGDVKTIEELFRALEADVEIDTANVQVFVSPADSNSTASGVYTANTNDWRDGTVTFTGAGNAVVTITDYYYCNSASFTVQVTPAFTLTMRYHKTNDPTTTVYLYMESPDVMDVANFRFTYEANNNITIDQYESAIGTVEGNTVSFTNGTQTLQTSSVPVLLGTFTVTGDYNQGDITLSGPSVNALVKGQQIPGVLTTNTASDHDPKIVWTPWTDSTSLPTESGHYYLTTHVSLANQVSLSDTNVMLCLNGYNITANATAAGTADRIYNVKDTAQLTICDCTEHYDTRGNYVAGQLTGASQGALMLPNRNDADSTTATINFYGGMITGNKLTESTGAAVLAQDGGTFNMYGGMICNNENVSDTGNGAGVYVGSNGTFKLIGGSICNNNAQYGAGVLVNHAGSVFDMTGGEIYGNTAMITDEKCSANVPGVTDTNGNPISVNSAYRSEGCAGGIAANGATVNISGGKIYDNTAKRNGGGIWMYKGTLTITGGEITGNEVIGSEYIHPSNNALRLLEYSGRGGGIYLYDTAATMANAEISNNIAGNGAGLFVTSANCNATLTNMTMKGNLIRSSGGMAIAVYGAAKCTVKDSVITENTSTGYYGGSKPGALGGQTAAVYVPNLNAVLKVEGDAYIFGNYAYNGNHRNIYLQDNNDPNGAANAKLDIGVLTAGAAMTVTTGDNRYRSVLDENGALKPDALDAVIRNNNYDESGKVPCLDTWQDSWLYWQNPTHSYIVADTANEKLVVKLHAHDDDTADVVWNNLGDTPTERTALPTAGGYYFLTADIELRHYAGMASGQEYVICLNGHSITAPATSRIYRISNGAKLTICDCTGKGHLYSGALKGGVVGMYNEDSTKAPPQLTIRDVTIDGNGRTTNVRGGAINNESQDVKGVTITIENVTFQNLKVSGTGGAISAGDAALTVKNSEFINCTATGNGGAIHHSNVGNTLVMEDVVIDGCTAANGAGIYFRGGDDHLGSGTLKNVTITNCTNTYESSVGSLFVYGTANHETGMLLDNCTLDGNCSNGSGASGVYLTCAKVKLTDCTIKNGTSSLDKAVAGIYIVASNKVTLSGKTEITGNVNSTNTVNNIILQNNVDNSGTADDPTDDKRLIPVLTFDHFDPASDVSIRMVGPFDDSNTAYAEDQNTYWKAVDCDSFEITLDNTDAVYTYDPVTNLFRSHVHAGDTADVVWMPWSDTRNLPNFDDVRGQRRNETHEDLYNGTETENGGYYYLTCDVELNGYRWFNTGEIHLCLNGHTISVDSTDSDAENKDAADRIYYLRNDAKLTICDCSENGHQGTLTGASSGAIMVPNTPIYQLDEEGNKILDTNGEPIITGYEQYNVEITLDNVIFEENHDVVYSGGAILVQAGTKLNVNNCIFRNNSSTSGGGAIYGGQSTINITNSQFLNNKADNGDATDQVGQAGAIYTNTCDLTIDNCTFDGNEADYWTGAIFAFGEGSEINISNSTFTGNQAKQYGVMHLGNECQATLTNVTMTGNIAWGGAAGALNIDGGADATLIDCTITGNLSLNYGAVYVYSNSSVLTVKGNTKIANNYICEVADDGTVTKTDVLRNVYLRTTEGIGPAFLQLKELGDDAQIGFRVAFDDQNAYEYGNTYRQVAVADADYTGQLLSDNALTALIIQQDPNNAAKWNISLKNPNVSEGGTGSATPEPAA